ncbi:MAG: endonuclease/exonuclease/phosphatase family protein [Actinomycetota bacterium]
MIDLRRFTPGAATVATAAGTALGVALIRLFIPLTFGLRETRGTLPAAALATFVFAAPLAYPGLAWALGPRGARLASAAGLGVATLGVQFVHPVPVWLGAVAVVFALFSWTFLLADARSVRFEGGTGFAAAAILGMALDTVVQGFAGGWDILWQTGPVATWTVMVVGVFALAIWRLVTGPDERTREVGLARVLPMAALGSFLALQILILGNVAFVDAAIGGSVAAGTAVVFAGQSAACVAIGVLGARSRAGVAAVGTGALVLVTWAIPGLHGVGLAVAMVAGSTMAGAMLGTALGRGGEPDRPGARRTAMALAIGMVGFAAVVFADQIDAVSPLPFDPRVLTAATAAAIGLAAMAPARRPTAARAPGRDPFALPLMAPLVMLAVAALVLGDTAPVRVPDRGTELSLRLVSWNVHAGVDAMGQVAPDRIAGAIEAQAPDVVVLQEVSRGWPIGGGLDLASWLSDRLGMRYVWAPAADGRFGNLILTRFPIVERDMVELPYGAGPQQRSAVAIEFEVAGTTLTVVGTHLETGTGTDTRAQQIAALTRAFGDRPHTVIAGDMNMQPGDDDVAAFTGAGLVSVQDAIGVPSEPTARDPVFPGDRVDWIFATSDLRTSEFEIAHSDASDHLPLAVTITVD